LALVHTFQKEGRNLQHFCREAIRHMRNLLIARVCGADSDLIAATPDQRPGLAKAAEQFSEEDLTRFFQILLQTDDDLRRKPDPRVHLEMGLLRLINAARLAPLEELMAELKSGARGMTASSLPAPLKKEISAVAPAMSAPPARSEPQSFASPAFAATQVEAKLASASTGWKASPVAAKSASAATAFAAATALEKQETVREETTAATVSSSVTAGEGISQEQVSEIKAAIQAQQKFLGELLEQSSRWELDGSELRIYFPTEKRPFAEMIEGRESLEKIRAASSNVLGRAVRVCAKLEAVAETAPAGSGKGAQELRAQFESDPMVRSMLQRFGGKISEVRRAQEES